MRKRFKMNLETGSVSPLSGTELPHPGNFPLGSPESRAAARMMASIGTLRAGDTGILEDGRPYIVTGRNSGDSRDKRVVVIVWPKDYIFANARGALSEA